MTPQVEKRNCRVEPHEEGAANGRVQSAETKVFGKQYADAYDDLYRDKDYDSEVRLLEKIFGTYHPGSVRRVLDLGCGTGNHALRLAARSFEVVGVDCSEEMLACARKKTEREGLDVTFHRSAICDFHDETKFDATLMMFAVLGYHHSNEDVLKALQAARASLRPGGILVFDVWYGPAVFAQKPGERVSVIEDGGATTIRTAHGQLSIPEHLCRVDYRLWRIRDNEVNDGVTETHAMRYFFPKELELFLTVAGFEMMRLAAFPEFDREADDSTWNVLVVARAV